MHFDIVGFVILQKNGAKGMTKLSYMKAVIDGLTSVDTVDVAFINSSRENCLDSAVSSSTQGKIERKRIFIRLLLSIDRRETTEAAMETVCMGAKSAPLSLRCFSFLS